MSEKEIPYNSGTDECDSPPLTRKKRRVQKQSLSSKSAFFSIFWAWFRAEQQNSRKIEDKYESVLYQEPKVDAEEVNNLPKRKSDFNKILSSGMSRKSPDSVITNHFNYF